MLARAPRRVDALLQAGEILMAQDRLQEAQELHTRAHRAAPEDLGPLYALVADADAREDPATARTYLKRIIELSLALAGLLLVSSVMMSFFVSVSRADLVHTADDIALEQLRDSSSASLLYASVMARLSSLPTSRS